MNKLDDEVLVQEVCRHLDASVAHLPLAIEQNLGESRQTALLQNAHLVTQYAEDLADTVSMEFDDRSTLSPDIEARLDQIRHSAVARFKLLQKKTTEPSRGSLSAWIKTQFDSFNFSASAGMLTTACVLVTAISVFYVNSRLTGSLTLEDEISLVATAEEIELYENLEFYLWLSENESLAL